jgi:hypothetical protein
MHVGVIHRISDPEGFEAAEQKPWRPACQRASHSLFTQPPQTTLLGYASGKGSQ